MNPFTYYDPARQMIICLKIDTEGCKVYHMIPPKRFDAPKQPFLALWADALTRPTIDGVHTR